MKSTCRIAASVFTLCITLLLAGQGFADVILTGAGATFPHPLYKKWIDVYQSEKDVRIGYRAVGSGAGIRLLLDRAVDFGATDAFLSDGEESRAAAKILHIPTCVGAVAIIYNLPLNAELKLTPDCVADIFQGLIVKWSDPRIGATNEAVKLPDLNITVVHRSDSSGTSFIFSDYLSKVSSRWNDRIGRGKEVQWPTGMGVEGNSAIAEFVARIPGSIGYVQMSYARNMNLPFVAVRNRSGQYVRPSLQSIRTAARVELPADGKILITDSPAPDGYPISAFTYIIFYQEQDYLERDRKKVQALAQFLWWTIHEGQAYNEKLYYSMLPEEAIRRAEQIIRTITYNGGAIAVW